MSSQPLSSLLPSLLAIDTSADACSVALLTPAISQQRVLVAPREHTQRLLPMVQSLLADYKTSISALDAIAVGIGPGSFTGLRIGLSVAQGLAYGADLPLVPVSTLQAMAQTAFRKHVVQDFNTVLSVIDARMNEVYWSAYQLNQESQQMESISKEYIDSPNELVEHDMFRNVQHLVGVGSGWHYPSLQKQSIVVEQAVYPEAIDIAFLAQHLYLQEKTVQPQETAPVYLREEVSWKKRQRIRKT